MSEIAVTPVREHKQGNDHGFLHKAMGWADGRPRR